MSMNFNRRQVALGLTGIAFGGLAACTGKLGSGAGASQESLAAGYDLLKPDPAGLLDLPAGFSYQILSSYGDAMSDGLVVPNAADGMGCFRLDERRIALVRNHELKVGEMSDGPAGKRGLTKGAAFDHKGDAALPGGTTTLILDAQTLKVEKQFLSLAGTIRNCAGGITPWGSWLSCEEDMTRAGQDGVGKDHGWVFEVPANGQGLADPVPLTVPSMRDGSAPVTRFSVAPVPLSKWTVPPAPTEKLSQPMIPGPLPWVISRPDPAPVPVIAMSPARTCAP